MEITTAGNPLKRLTGLVGRRPDPDRALYLPRTRSIHTFGVRGALDLIWVDGDGNVLRIDRAVPPRRLRSCRAARGVFECGAGAADRLLARL